LEYSPYYTGNKVGVSHSSSSKTWVDFISGIKYNDRDIPVSEMDRILSGSILISWTEETVTKGKKWYPSDRK